MYAYVPNSAFGAGFLAQARQRYFNRLYNYYYYTKMNASKCDYEATVCDALKETTNNSHPASPNQVSKKPDEVPVSTQEVPWDLSIEASGASDQSEKASRVSPLSTEEKFFGVSTKATIDDKVGPVDCTEAVSSQLTPPPSEDFNEPSDVTESFVIELLEHVDAADPSDPVHSEPTPPPSDDESTFHGGSSFGVKKDKPQAAYSEPITPTNLGSDQSTEKKSQSVSSFFVTKQDDLQSVVAAKPTNTPSRLNFDQLKKQVSAVGSDETVYKKVKTATKRKLASSAGVGYSKRVRVVKEPDEDGWKHYCKKCKDVVPDLFAENCSICSSGVSYQCQRCKKVYKNYKYVPDHTCFNFQCHLCGFRCDRKYSLQYHYRQKNCSPSQDASNAPVKSSCAREATPKERSVSPESKLQGKTLSTESTLIECTPNINCFLDDFDYWEAEICGKSPSKSYCS